MTKPTLQRASRVLLQPVIRKTAISTAIALAVTPVAIHANNWNNNVEIFLSAGNNRAMVGAQALIPIKQDADSLWYADIRGMLSDRSTNEINLGGGYRQFSSNGDWILGSYLAYDSRESRTGTHWDQITLGLEALSDTWDFRGNIYETLDDEKLLYTTGGGVAGAVTFSGYSLISGGGGGTSVYEEALSGFDLEAGRLLPIGPDNHEIRGYLGLYHYDGKIANDADGVSARLEWRPRRNITVQLAAQSDNLFDDSLRFQVAWSIDRPTKAGKRKLRERMTQFVQRDIDIRETSVLPEEERTETQGAGGGGTTTATDIVHIDDALGDTPSVVEGDGTAENPFRSFGECLLAAGTQGCAAGKTTQYVYVHTGTSVAGTAYDTSDADGDGAGGDADFQLQPNVTLAGEGAAFFTIAAGTAPEVTASGGSDVITLLGSNTVQGLEINGDSGDVGDGIVVNNTASTHIIQNNTIDGVDIGINVYTISSSDTVSILNNIINNNSDYGVVAENEANTGAASTQSVTMTDNTLDNNQIGVYAYNLADDGNATQTLTLTGNTITNSNNEGIEIENFGYDATASQTITLSGNTISDNGSRGVRITNEAEYYGTANQGVTVDGNNIIDANDGPGISVRNIVSGNYDATATSNVYITGNTITNNTSTGIELQNEGNAYEGATATQTATISNNTIDGNYTGIDITNGAYNDSAGTQNVTISGNTITNNNDYGIQARNYGESKYEDATQGLTITNNIITGNDYGVSLQNSASGYDDGYGGAKYGTAIQTATLSGNTITGNTYGLHMENDSNYYADATQTVTASNNALDNNTGAGVYIRNGGYPYANATQTLNLTSNTITGSGGYGISAYNFADYGTATQTVDASGGGNTITGTLAGAGYDVYAYQGEYNAGSTTTIQTVDLSGGNTYGGYTGVNNGDTQNIP